MKGDLLRTGLVVSSPLPRAQREGDGRRTRASPLHLDFIHLCSLFFLGFAAVLTVFATTALQVLLSVLVDTAGRGIRSRVSISPSLN